MQGLIITGKGGGLLGALMQNRPIAMLPVGDYSLLAHQVDLLARGGIRDILIMATDSGVGEIKKCLAQREDVCCRLITGQGVAHWEKHHRLLADTSLVVLTGPLLTDLDMSQVVGFHKARGGSATLFLRRIWQQRRENLVATDSRGRVKVRALARWTKGGRQGKG